MRAIWTISASVALALGANLPALAIASYSGDLTGQPVFDTPNEGNPPTSTVGAAIFPYQSQPFFVDITGSYDFLSTSTGYTTAPTPPPAPVWNNYTVLYQGSFNPSTPLANAIIANDDLPSSGLSGFNGVPLTANAQYFFVTTVFNPDDGYGTFTNTIARSGGAPANISLGTVTAVPFEFSPTLGLLILSGAWGLNSWWRYRQVKN